MPKAKTAKALDPAKDFSEPVKKQADLPGMENRAIEELEAAARRYAAIRDKRMALNDAEVKLKALLLGLLKKHDKREYKRDGISIWIKVEEETVKVKIEEDDDEGGGKNEPIRDKQDARGKSPVGQGKASDSEGAASEAEPEDSEARSETGAVREAGEEGPEDF